MQAAVPSLVASVKDAGLLLATFGSVEDVGKLRTGTADGRTVDAFVIDGYVGLFGLCEQELIWLTSSIMTLTI